MDTEPDLPFPPLPDETTTATTTGGRELCSSRCGRPLSSCLCSHLPTPPIPTLTTVLILQHPHELRHRLSTVPFLTKSLLNCHVITGRRLLPGSHPLLDPTTPHTTLFLFPTLDPSFPATPIRDWATSSSPPRHPLLLVVFDGTWGHAREMAVASRGFLGGFAAHVTLGVVEGEEGESTWESELVLRKEPVKGCVSTMEAVARALRVLEPEGEAVEARLLEVLRAMVKVQAVHLKPTKPRARLKKKKERET